MPLEFVHALPVLEKIAAQGFEAYFVGGSVRDVLLKRKIHDVDIATNAYPEEIKAIFPHTIDVGIEHGTVLVLAGKTEAEHYEITTFRTESKYTDFRRPDHVDFVRELKEDLKRRDFTINAFACDASGEIIDLFDGLTDLSNRRLRAVGIAEDRFNEDALRIMRALRFAASLNFEIESKTFAAMKNRAHLLTKISVERIFIELDKLFLSAGWRKGLQNLIDSEVWKFLPELNLTVLSKMIMDLSDDFQFKSSEQAWAGLLTAFDAVNPKSFLQKWKVSNQFIRDVSELLAAYQLSKWDLTSIYQYGLTKAKLIDDLKCAHGQKIDFDEAVKFDQLLQIHERSEIVIKGADLINIGFVPGPDIGKILDEIEEKIVTNQLKNEREEILNFVRNSSLHFTTNSSQAY